jgi:predicted nucleic acid-binding protein
VKKLKLYLDTSVISHLDAPDAPEKMADTLKLWELLKKGEFEVYISTLLMTEIERCAQPKRSFIVGKLDDIEYTTLMETDEIAQLANQYVKAGVLAPRHFIDCQHIAYACIYNCDIIVSWNFRHMVNYKVINGVKAVNILTGYKEMLIYSPTILISGLEEENEQI